MRLARFTWIFVFIIVISSVSCSKETIFVNGIDFNGTSITEITSLYYFSDNSENILYFTRFIEDGSINPEDYIYCIIDNSLIGTDVDILECETPFEWVAVLGDYNYFVTEEVSSFFLSGTFRIDKKDENYFTVIADFITHDSKKISVRWQGYFSYSEFNID